MDGRRIFSNAFVIAAAIITAAAVLILSTAAFAADISAGTYAGTGEFGSKNDQRLLSGFNFPYGLALDRDGSLIVADSNNNLIRKITEDKVTTIAGISDKKDPDYGFPLGGFADGDALKARFNKPRAVVVDSRGNIFVSDTENNAIRKITEGKVYTFAGNGTAGYVDGKGIDARFNKPSGMAIDRDDNLYIADTLNNVIRKITPNGEVSTLAGQYADAGDYKDGAAKSARFNEPGDVAVDKSGAVYVADTQNQLIRKVYNGQVTTVAGTRDKLIEGTPYAQGGFKNGLAKTAKFNAPKGIDVADDGTIFIADMLNHRVRAVKPNGDTITIAGTGIPGRVDGPVTNALFNGPVDVLYGSGSLYISDMWNNCIRTIPIKLGSLPSSSDLMELVEGIPFDTKTSDIQVWFDKKAVKFPDVKPYLAADNSIYIPMKVICEAWGAEVKWLSDTKQVRVKKGSFSQKDVFYRKFTPDNKTVVYKNGRTWIESVYLAKTMNLRVEWIDEYRAVVISQNK